MVERKTNPRTQVTTVQKEFEAELYRRLWRDNRERAEHTPLREKIYRHVVERDMLGLETITLRRGARLQFESPENPEKAAEFEELLDAAISAGVLERMDRGDIVNGRHYSGTYVRQASEQGVKHGHRELARVGIDPDDDASISAILRTPVHEDVLRSGYLRAYDELENVSSAMATDISRTMSEALRDGVNPRETARRMNERVDDVGLTRSRRIARTETARAYNDHSLARYSDHGIEQVKLLTSAPCDTCADLAADGPYPVGQAPSVPANTHPNCVCSWSPVV